MNGTKKLWWGLLLLVLVSPLGLWLPEIFKSGPAWGEWGLRELEKMLGFVPEGAKNNAGLWSAPVPDYNLKGWEGKGLLPSSLGYILSAFLGVGAIALVAFLLGKVLTRKEKAGNRNS